MQGIALHNRLHEINDLIRQYQNGELRLEPRITRKLADVIRDLGIKNLHIYSNTFHLTMLRLSDTDQSRRLIRATALKASHTQDSREIVYQFLEDNVISKSPISEEAK